MRMMEVTVDQIVDVIAVRNGFVPTSGAMHMIRIVAAALVGRRAASGVRLADFDFVFDNRAVFGHMVQVPIVQVIDMVTVLDTDVFAVRPVLVVVVFVGLAHHFLRSWGN